jgi:hypothetical protein
MKDEDVTDAPALHARARAVKDLVQREFNLSPIQETNAYTTFLVPRNQTKSLPLLLDRLSTDKQTLGITDMQVRPHHGVCLQCVFRSHSREA